MEKNETEILNIIVQSKTADINLKDFKNQSPLIVSLRSKNYEIFSILLRNGATLDDCLFREVSLNGDCTAVNILLEFSRQATLKGLKSLSEKNLSYIYLFLKFSPNVNIVKLDLLDNEFKLTVRDSIDLFDELKKLLIQMNTQKLVHYLESLIIFFKYNYFDIYTLKTIRNILNIIYEIYSKLDDTEIKNRIIYVFGLAVYSSHLDLNKENKEWTLKLAARKEFEQIFSLAKSPLSLRALCRIQIKKSFKPFDSLFNSRENTKKIATPSVLIKYLDYEYL